MIIRRPVVPALALTVVPSSTEERNRDHHMGMRFEDLRQIFSKVGAMFALDPRTFSNIFASSFLEFMDLLLSLRASRVLSPGFESQALYPRSSVRFITAGVVN